MKRLIVAVVVALTVGCIGVDKPNPMTKKAPLEVVPAPQKQHPPTIEELIVALEESRSAVTRVREMIHLATPEVRAQLDAYIQKKMKETRDALKEAEPKLKKKRRVY